MNSPLPPDRSPPALIGRTWHRATETIYAAYVWGLLFTLAPIVWLLTAVLPRISWRWPLIRRAANLYRRMLRISLEVEGLENLARFIHPELFKESL